MIHRRVSLLVATRKRLERLRKFLNSYNATTEAGADSEIVFRVDYDDPESLQLLTKYGWAGIVGSPERCLASRYNEMARVATGDILLCCTDGVMIETPGWPKLIIEAANRYADGIFDVRVNTGVDSDSWGLPCVSVELVKRLGFISDERLAHSHLFLLDVAKHFGRAIRLSTVKFRREYGDLRAHNSRHDVDETEIEDEFVDSADSWTAEYRNLHDRAVAEAVSRIDQGGEFQAGQALLAFEAYRPPQSRPSPPSPPLVSALSWSAAPDGPGIAYHREETFELFKAIATMRLPRRRVLLTSFGNGLPALLWGQLYDQVINLHEATEPHPIEYDKYRLEFGTVANARFMYSMLRRIDPVDAVIIDSADYARLISPYFLLRRTMPQPSIIVVMNTGIQAARLDISHPRRFVDDLCSGRLDGTLHCFSHIEILGGKGISYEVLGEPGVAAGQTRQYDKQALEKVLELETRLQQLAEKKDGLAAELEAQIQVSNAKLSASMAEIEVLRARIAAILNSKSWRITLPLRTGRRLLDWGRRPSVSGDNEPRR
jgi:hypothetical protein